MPRQSYQPSAVDGALPNTDGDPVADRRTLILDHSRHPRNFGTLASANRTGKAENPVCGDRYQVFLNVMAGRIEAVRFRGTGCAISMASASMMMDLVEHQPVGDAESLVDNVRKLLAGELSEDSYAALGDLVALAGVRPLPLRMKCAILPWHALLAALRDESNPASTK